MITKSIWLTIWHEQWPIMALPVVPQFTPNNNPIIPIIPTKPLFPPHLQPQRPFHLGEDITVVGSGTQFVRVEARDQDHYWITCQVDNTGVKFTTQVNWGLVIDPNPQDVLSQLNQVGCLIWFWWGHLSKLVHQSWRIWYWWLGREMRGRGEHREGPSGMSSEGMEHQDWLCVRS